MISLLLGILSGCSNSGKDGKRYEASFLELFDTMTTVVGYAESEEDFRADVEKIHTELLELHQLYDIYNNYEGINNIKTINDNAGVRPVTVDRRIIELLLFSKEAYELTGGRVNVAMGRVLSIWHAYRTAGVDDPEHARLPSQSDLESASLHTDIGSLVIDEDASTVYLSDPESMLDVGSIAKGYATEQVCRRARAGLLVSVGGNVRATGAKNSNGDPWIVGIQDPRGETGVYLHTVNVTNVSVVTSGSYQRYYTVDGKQYCHIIDSETLWPSDRYLSVTIITADSGLADVLSTALYTMSLDDGLALITSLDDTEASWVLPDGSVKYSGEGYREYIKDENSSSVSLGI